MLFKIIETFQEILQEIPGWHFPFHATGCCFARVFLHLLISHLSDIRHQSNSERLFSQATAIVGNRCWLDPLQHACWGVEHPSVEHTVRNFMLRRNLFDSLFDCQTFFPRVAFLLLWTWQTAKMVPDCQRGSGVLTFHKAPLGGEWRRVCQLSSKKNSKTHKSISKFVFQPSKLAFDECRHSILDNRVLDNTTQHNTTRQGKASKETKGQTPDTRHLMRETSCRLGGTREGRVPLASVEREGSVPFLQTERESTGTNAKKAIS